MGCTQAVLAETAPGSSRGCELEIRSGGGAGRSASQPGLPQPAWHQPVIGRAAPPSEIPLPAKLKRARAKVPYAEDCIRTASLPTTRVPFFSCSQWNPWHLKPLAHHDSGWVSGLRGGGAICESKSLKLSNSSLFLSFPPPSCCHLHCLFLEL